jgi:hypothetical protein
LQELQWFAELLRTKILLEINHLLHRDRRVTAVFAKVAGSATLWSSGASNAAVACMNGSANGLE